MECLIGIQCKNFVMIVADQIFENGRNVLKTDQDKIHKLSKNIAMGIVGDYGDASQFKEFIAKNIQLYKMRNGYEMSPTAVVNFTRNKLLQVMIRQAYFTVNMMVGGWEEESGASLYYIDYLGSCVKVPFFTHGYAGLSLSSILDQLYREAFTQDEAYELMKACVRDIHKHYVGNLANFKVVVVDKNGVAELPRITAHDLALENQ